MKRLPFFLLCAVFVLSGCEWQEQGVAWSWERMIDQRHFDAYEATDFFPDGTVMRRPPEGTVPHDAPAGPVELLAGYRGGREVAARAGLAGPAAPERGARDYVTEIPIRLGLEDLQRGRASFRVYCSVCHGLLGDGESMVAPNMSLRPPPSLLEEPIRGAPVGKLFSVVSEGFGFMPSYGAELSIRERWEVVAYVRALQLSRRAPLDQIPPEVRERALRELSEGPVDSASPPGAAGAEDSLEGGRP